MTSSGYTSEVSDKPEIFYNYFRSTGTRLNLWQKFTKKKLSTSRLTARTTKEPEVL